MLSITDTHEAREARSQYLKDVNKKAIFESGRKGKEDSTQVQISHFSFIMTVI